MLWRSVCSSLRCWGHCRVRECKRVLTLLVIRVRACVLWRLIPGVDRFHHVHQARASRQGAGITRGIAPNDGRSNRVCLGRYLISTIIVVLDCWHLCFIFKLFIAVAVIVVISTITAAAATARVGAAHAASGAIRLAGCAQSRGGSQVLIIVTEITQQGGRGAKNRRSYRSDGAIVAGNA